MLQRHRKLKQSRTKSMFLIHRLFPNYFSFFFLFLNQVEESSVCVSIQFYLREKGAKVLKK